MIMLRLPNARFESEGDKRAALENVATVLKAAGSGLEHIVKATIYLTNMERDFVPMNEVYAAVGAINENNYTYQSD